MNGKAPLLGFSREVCANMVDVMRCMCASTLRTGVAGQALEMKCDLSVQTHFRGKMYFFKNVLKDLNSSTCRTTAQ